MAASARTLLYAGMGHLLSWSSQEATQCQQPAEIDQRQQPGVEREASRIVQESSDGAVPGLLDKGGGHSLNTQPEGLPTLGQEPGPDGGQRRLVGQRPHHTSEHRAGQQENQTGRAGKRSGSGKEPAPSCLERADGERIGNTDRGHDPIGEPLGGSHQRQSRYELGDFTLGAYLLYTRLTAIEVLLHLWSGSSAEATVDLVGREMISGRTGHKWTLLRSG